MVHNESLILYEENIKNPEMYFLFKENKFSLKMVTMATSAFYMVHVLLSLSQMFEQKNKKVRYLDKRHTLCDNFEPIKYVLCTRLPW